MHMLNSMFSWKPKAKFFKARLATLVMSQVVRFFIKKRLNLSEKRLETANKTARIKLDT